MNNNIYYSGRTFMLSEIFKLKITLSDVTLLVSGRQDSVRHMTVNSSNDK